MKSTQGVAIGKCPDCGKVCYVDRKSARRAGKRRHAGEHMSPYKCGEFWHIGHLPRLTIDGKLDRDTVRAIRKGRRTA